MGDKAYFYSLATCWQGKLKGGYDLLETAVKICPVAEASKSRDGCDVQTELVLITEIHFVN